MIKNYLVSASLLISSLFSAQGVGLDLNFAQNGVTPSESTDRFEDIEVSYNGKILIAGEQLQSTPYYNGMVKRYLPNGSVDLNFGTSGVASIDGGFSQGDIFHALKELPDHKILAVGKTDTAAGMFNYNYNLFMVRLNEDGTLDTTFGNNGKVVMNLGTNYDNGEKIFTDSAGRIVIFADKDAVSEAYQYTRGVVMRFLPNGILDTTFAQSGILEINPTYYSKLNDLVFLNDGSMLIGGSYGYDSNDTYNRDMFIYKVDENGNFVNSFGTNGVKILDMENSGDFLSKIDVLPDGKIQLISAALSFGPKSTYISRLNPDGSYDTTYKNSGKYVPNTNIPNHNKLWGGNVLILPDGNYLLCSSSQWTVVQNGNYDFVMVGLLQNGERNNAFNNTGSYAREISNAHEYLYSQHLAPDGGVYFIDQYRLYKFTNTYTLRLSEAVSNKNLTIYPNPAQNVIHLNTNERVLEIQIININGQTIRTVKDSKQLEVRDLPSGNYFLKISLEKEIVTLKFIKQ
ncbi:T9SS C-terminal target domain-containing protein [Chryseobacterium carnipullorum]|uniref:T9SS C-terminal target domain-containing protein n=1 Tax=Chryseobacterium carnipullorum TaxID=1124835 RepID=A0A3G6NA81_CHRCU|nr:T9SS type A sorting domain-containing protein [Chryseobacterium carnipullorum]AZA50104.1 T9SS C-terminal target domain-containing protein [Chryseobacterium carnipullorum]AZA64980.1 T9SS C-terminal target domain-containing protein [Chryseobacterium carnipullorum]